METPPPSATLSATVVVCSSPMDRACWRKDKKRSSHVCEHINGRAAAMVVSRTTSTWVGRCGIHTSIRPLPTPVKQWNVSTAHTTVCKTRSTPVLTVTTAVLMAALLDLVAAAPTCNTSTVEPTPRICEKGGSGTLLPIGPEHDWPKWQQVWIILFNLFM